MLPSCLLLLTLIAPAELPSSSETEGPTDRQRAARELRESLALAEENSARPALALQAMLHGSQRAMAELEGDAFADTLEALVSETQPKLRSASGELRDRMRDSLEQAIGDLEFEWLREAELPIGFPEPTSVRHIEVKSYPRYRLVRAESDRGAFWKLFSHIKENEIAMTAPVEMTFDEGENSMQETHMAFLYGDPDLGKAGANGDVSVVDVDDQLVVSLGCRGRMSQGKLREARGRLVAWIAQGERFEVDGDLRVMGYNSPMVPSSRQFFEVQFPVRDTSDDPKQSMVIDFGSAQELQGWRAVNDSVMGGRSRSSIGATLEGTARFEGVMSLENNGGFASVRSRPRPMDMKSRANLRLKVRGDGQTYKLRLRTDDRWDGASYEVRFETSKDAWSEHEFALADFRAVWRGRGVPGARALDFSEVVSVGVMISDKQDGDFALELHSLTQD